jgi:predicted nicotinamide N-methyase
MTRRFFDEYERFYRTSDTSPAPERLDFRYHLIIEQNQRLLTGKRVVEIASHDGRWAFAAIKAGARYVRGVEPRQRLVDNAFDTFSSYGIPNPLTISCATTGTRK